ncbi:hypothetical protein JX266_002332 [Neoarthrinium moseri]|nr:hypothetical protein JX266_002332 [Neoarthrinium moseri]
MTDALEIANFYSHVEFFTEKFLQACSESNPRVGDSFARPPTSREKARIANAMYTFELFRRLFGNLSLGDLSELVPLFFSKLAPWEGAQLGCVHDFLAREVIPAYNELAMHDITWAEHSVVATCDLSSPQIQFFLSKGLPNLHVIATATSYEEKALAFATNTGPPGISYYFLMAALEMIDAAEDLNEDELTSIVTAHPLYEDCDPGPKQIWELSKGQRQVAIYGSLDWAYRRWGYVMWDCERLDALGALDVWNPEQEEEPYVEAVSHENMWNSIKWRTEIYWAGGRGWWDEDDQSHIVWPDRADRGNDEPAARGQHVPATLDEAKKLWRARFQED